MNGGVSSREDLTLINEYGKDKVNAMAYSQKIGYIPNIRLQLRVKLAYLRRFSQDMKAVR